MLLTAPFVCKSVAYMYSINIYLKWSSFDNLLMHEKQLIPKLRNILKLCACIYIKVKEHLCNGVSITFLIFFYKSVLGKTAFIGSSLHAKNMNSSSSKSSNYHVRALYSYLSSGEHQLSFHEGDVIVLIGDRNKGWQYGENLRNHRWVISHNHHLPLFFHMVAWTMFCIGRIAWRWRGIGECLPTEYSYYLHFYSYVQRWIGQK